MSTFSTRLVSLLSKLFDFVMFFSKRHSKILMVLIYAIHQPSTDTMQSKDVQRVASRRYVSLEGDKNFHLPQGSRLDERNPALRSWLLIWKTNKASDKTNDISRTLLSLVFAGNSSTVRPRARQMTAKGFLLTSASAMYLEDGVSAAQCNTMSSARLFPIPYTYM